MQQAIDNYASLIKSVMAGLIGASITFTEDLTVVVRLLIALVTLGYILWKFYSERKKFCWRQEDRKSGKNKGYGPNDK